MFGSWSSLFFKKHLEGKWLHRTHFKRLETRKFVLKISLLRLPWWFSGYDYAPKTGGLGLILGQGARSYMIQLRVQVPQLGSGAAKEINEYLKNKSLALKVGSVMERKKEFGILARGLLLTCHLVLNYFGSVCTEIILILDKFFSS